MLDLWRGQRCVIGLALPELLLASLIKLWAARESDDEWLDAFNALLLSPNLDVFFDRGFRLPKITAFWSRPLYLSLSASPLVFRRVGELQGCDPNMLLTFRNTESTCGGEAGQ